MRLSDYLQQTTLREFERRSGVDRSTLRRLLAGHGCTLLNADRIVRATGGLVSYQDLLAEHKGQPAA